MQPLPLEMTISCLILDRFWIFLSQMDPKGNTLMPLCPHQSHATSTLKNDHILLNSWPFFNLLESNGPQRQHPCQSFKRRGCLTLIRTRGDKGVAFVGQTFPFLGWIDSKILKNGQGWSKIWSFLRGEVTWLLRTKGDKGVAFGGQIYSNFLKQLRIKDNTAIFKGRGCVTLIRTKGD